MDTRGWKESPGLVVATLLLFSGLEVSPVPVVAQKAESSDPVLSKIKSQAESQHEIVMILVRKKEYAKALDEAGKIFGMKWPVDQEPLLLKELQNLSDRFLREGQAALGLQLLERSAKAFKTTESRVAILKEKGYLHKSLNQDDKALECFREAQRLEATGKQ
ncbi:MAG: hypothetical protein HXY20_04665 [Acidobacteria bacterium]|nr:hypothetical protein [Acidobacteriota bacterium]